MAKFLLVLLLTMSLALGCSSSPDAGDNGNTDLGPMIVSWAPGEPDLINPILGRHDDHASHLVEEYIFEGLVGYDGSMQPVGKLARDWEISSDSLVWTFYLREGVQWHDGQPFTARDVEFTYNTIAKNPDYPGNRRLLFSVVDTVQVVDEHTIQLHLNTPYSPLFSVLRIGILPSHIFDPQHAQGENQVAIRDMFEHPANHKPIGTGPWALEDWTDGEHIILRANENHWRQAPSIPRLKITLLNSESAAISALEAGELSWLDYVPGEDLPRLQDNLKGKYTFYSYQDLTYEYLDMNFREDAFGLGENPFRDILVRRAMAHAVDRQELIEEIYQGRAIPVHSPIPPASWAFQEEGLKVYDYNPALAGELLDKAGWLLAEDGWRYKDGQILAFSIIATSVNNYRVAALPFYEKYFNALGIKITETKAVGWPAMMENYVFPGNYQLALLGMNMDVDPDYYKIFHSDNNPGGLVNTRVDQLLTEGRQTIDLDSRKEIYAELQREMAQDLPQIFLFSRMHTAVAKENLRGIVVSPQGLINPESWHME